MNFLMLSIAMMLMMLSGYLFARSWYRKIVIPDLRAAAAKETATVRAESYSAGWQDAVSYSNMLKELEIRFPNPTPIPVSKDTE